MTTTTVKAKIKKRFGSMAKFAKLINKDRYELQKFFAAAEKKMTPERYDELQKLSFLVKTTKNENVATDLTPELCDMIKKKIEDEFGGVPGFCVEHPKFNQFSVWQIIQGRRKTISASVKELLKTLKIEIHA